MPVTPTYPGVYIEEIPSGVRTITGVSTSITAFVGYTPRGPVNKAVQIFNMGDYVRQFGGLARNSEIGYAVQQFFLNGGSEGWVVRSATGALAASVDLQNEDGLNVLTLTAKSEGAWGSLLRADVDTNTTSPASSFNLTVTEYLRQGQNLVPGRVEVFRNLSMDSKSSNYAPNVVTAGSELVKLVRHADVTPAVLQALAPGWSMSGDLSALNFADLTDNARFISIIVDGDGPYEIAIFPQGSPPATLDALVTGIRNAVRGINLSEARFSAFDVKRVDAAGSDDAAGAYLMLVSGSPAAERESSSVQVLNAASRNASKLLSLGLANKGSEGAAAAALRPARNGTLSGNLATVDLSTLNAAHVVAMTVAAGGTTIGAHNFSLGAAVTTLDELAALLQTRIRATAPAEPAFSKAVVLRVGSRLQIITTTDRSDAVISFTDQGGGSLAADLLLNAANATANVQHYTPDGSADAGFEANSAAGNDGAPPNATALIGNPDAKTGLYALLDVDLFNLLAIPLMAEMNENDAAAVIAAAQTLCETRRAFLLVDPPTTTDTLTEMKSWMTDKATPNKNAAVYFPFVQIPDPLDNNRLRAVPPSGTVAGLMARTDASRGVWKAPAGTEAILQNVQGLGLNLTDPENGALNTLGVNCLRTFPGYGRVAWGARTMFGSDQQASEWKYIPVRRLALFLEESLYRGTKWVVFEPNDEPLWAQIRLNIGSFMHNLFRQGAFQGKTPQEAYLVKCDSETTTQADINAGVVNILVGFAPLKPAEFVIIQIQQLAGKLEV